MTVEMKKYRLADIAEIVISSVDKKTKPGEKIVRLCNFTDVYHNWAIKQSDYDSFMVASASDNNINKLSLKKGFVAFTKDSETRDDIGISTYIADDFDDVVLGYHCALAKPNEKIVYGKYLNAFMSSDYIKKYFELNATGSGMRFTLAVSTMEDMPIMLPSLNVQKKIGDMLSDFDKRIENLRVQNRVLEQTAKTIYDYTFLQCAGHQTTYNKTLNRNIPTNWEVKSVNQMAKSYRGVAYDKSDVQKENNGGILVLRGNNIQDNNLVYDGNVVYIPENLVEDNQHIKKGDIIMTMSSGSKEHIGKCTMFQYDSKHTYGAFLTKFTPKKECRYYFYMNLISEYFKAKIKSVCNGTGINNLTNQTFDEIFFPYPDSKTLDFFEKTVTPVFDKIGVNTKQIETLTTQRNTLLPLLMTGQVTID